MIQNIKSIPQNIIPYKLRDWGITEKNLYKLVDASFIQGLIQLSVSYFHYFNGNIKGAKSMIKKCLIRFKTFAPETLMIPTPE